MNISCRPLMLAISICALSPNAVAQDECAKQIEEMEKIGDLKAALECVNKRTSESEAQRKEELSNRLKALTVTVTGAQTIRLTENTNGKWAPIPNAENADACFFTSFQVPPAVVCEMTYNHQTKRWSYHLGYNAGTTFSCRVTCISVKLSEKPAN